MPVAEIDRLVEQGRAWLIAARLFDPGNRRGHMGSPDDVPPHDADAAFAATAAAFGIELAAPGAADVGSEADTAHAAGESSSTSSSSSSSSSSSD